MSTSRRVLLINPTITGKRHARFPLAVLSLASALKGKHTTRILDGNVERDFVDSAVKTVQAGEVDAIGVTVMGGPQLLSAIAVSKGNSGRERPQCRSSGAVLSRPSVPMPRSECRTSTMRSDRRGRIPSRSCWMRSVQGTGARFRG